MASKATEFSAASPNKSLNESLKTPEMAQPLVSVIIPAYNAARYIERTLASVLTQTHDNLEVIVVDDGSSDDTPAIVQRWSQRDQRVRLVQQVNGGVAIARNTGIAQAQGEFIAPVDADDIWYATNLEQQIQQLIQAGPSAGVCYAWSLDIDEHDQPNGGFRADRIEGRVYRSMLCHNFLGNASCTVIRRSALEAIGGYDSSLKQHQAQGCEDWDLYLRLAEKHDYCVAPQFLIGYRKTDAAMSGDYRQMGRSQALMLDAVRQSHPEIPGFLYRLSRSSFYMYLARQSELSHQPRETLHWLGQALKAECLTPLGRYGLYSMALGSLGKIWRGEDKPQPILPTDASGQAEARIAHKHEAHKHEAQSDETQTPVLRSPASPPSPSQEPGIDATTMKSLKIEPYQAPDELPGGFSLTFKLGLGKLLHRLLQ